MKRQCGSGVLAAMLCVLLLAGCSGKLTGSPQLTNETADTLGYAVGLYVGGKNDPKLERTVAEVYAAVQQGQVTPELVNRALAYFDVNKPAERILARKLTRLAASYGFQFDPSGLCSGIGQVDPAIFPVIADAYRAGLADARL